LQHLKRGSKVIDSNILKELKSGKNLLAFSAGVDSSALFYILVNSNIEFDIALVNYGTRDESDLEEEWAKELAKSYNKKAFTTKAPKFSSNFEANAREFRYNFFKNIIAKEGYCNLITAHQLNDKLEWLLMRLGKGAGVSELSGMSKIYCNSSYNIIRPLLDYTKDELLRYLKSNHYRYFVDSSNFDKKYERNRFRPIVNELLKDSKSGFVKSFEILKKESDILRSGYEMILREKELIVAKVYNKQLLDSAASNYLKELGYLISGKERQELLKSNSLVAGRRWAVELVEDRLFISPYITITLPKEFKEFCRVKKIPPKVRGYIYKESLQNKIESLLAPNE
jgi:tRNA(Ile)-lysidine synthase